MKILLDAFGGDNSPSEIIKGAVEYIKDGGKAEICLVGKQDIINEQIENNGYDKKGITILNADEVITCEESPTEAFRKKPNSSICVALDALKSGDYDAFVSAGSTGAILTAAVFKSGRIKGISRPALATILPTLNGKSVMFLDCGANADCKPINLVHFAIMADAYMRTVEGIENPRIALLSNGTEDKKGNELNHQVFGALKQIKELNFVGNIEARTIMSGECDAVIADGFSGNVALKSAEGAIATLVSVLKGNIKSSLSASIGYKVFMQKAFKNTMGTLDYNKRGGAVLLGVNGVVIKSHGSSKAAAIKASILQAEKAAQNNLSGEIALNLNAESLANIKFE